LQDYHVVSSGPGRIAGFDSYGWRFTASAPGIGAEPRVQIYGRGDLILPPGASRGVTLVALATSRADDVHGAAEVGQSGPLKAILDSFHLAVSTAAPPSPGVASRTPDTSALRNETGTSSSPTTPPETRPRPAAPAPPARPATTPPATHATPNAPPAPRPAPAATPAATAPALTPAPTAPAPTPPPPAPPRAPPPGNGQ
jgi:hypothetical protein